MYFLGMFLKVKKKLSSFLTNFYLTLKVKIKYFQILQLLLQFLAICMLNTH